MIIYCGIVRGSCKMVFRSVLMNELNERLGTGFYWGRLCKLDLERLVVALRERDGLVRRTQELLSDLDTCGLCFGGDLVALERVLSVLEDGCLREELDKDGGF